MTNPRKEASENAGIRRKTDFNFGFRGWMLLLYCCLGFMSIGGAWWAGTAQNVMASAKAAQIGVETSGILSMNSLGGFIAIPAVLGFGILFVKYKTRIMQTLLMLLCGAVLMFYGRVSSLVGYLVCFLLLEAVGNTTSSVGLPQIIVAYFPTKKGSAMGWATIGANLASLVSLTVLVSLRGEFGIEIAVTMFGVFTIIMGLINWFFIPNTPEEAGMKPDNGDFTEQELADHRAMMSKPPCWTLKEAVHNRNFWILPIAYGLLFMASNGFMSQMIPHQISQMIPRITQELIESGIDPVSAVETAAGKAAGIAQTYVQINPAFAVPGSILTGWLDQKIGTRRTGMLMAFFYCAAGLAGGLLPYNSLTNWMFMGLFFWWNGANAYLVMSHAVSVFGPRDYPGLWGRMAPILNLCRVFAPLVLSLSLAMSGGYKAAYTVLGIFSFISLILLYISDNRVSKQAGEAPIAY